MARLRALVCDDEQVVRSVVSSLLEACGYEVVGQAGLALESLVMADIVQPDVIVLDLSLPGMSGMEVIPTLRTAAPEAVIIVFTAFDTMRDRAMAAGAFEVVDKADMNGLTTLEYTLQVVAETVAVRSG
jgi:CheY-like chemotaxis protein